MASDELHRLLRVLSKRDIPLDSDDIAWAFEGGETKSSIEAWTKQYLSSACLLTSEELEFSKIADFSQSSGAKPGYAGRPLEDNELAAAIASLEASTTAIEKQCRLLSKQKEALWHLRDRHASRDTTSAQRDDRQKTLAREKARLDFEIDEISGTLQSRLQVSSRQADTALVSLPSSIERLLEKDDRLIDGLQKLLPKLDESDPTTEVELQVDRLCQALTTLSAREIRLRIDAAYSQHAQADTTQTNGHRENNSKEMQMIQQRDSIRSELEELCNEIESLATMAVDNQYRLPITRELASSQTDSELDKARWSEYMASTLQYITARLEALTEHGEHLHAHSSAIKQVASILENLHVTPKTNTTAATLTTSRSPSTPTAKGLKPLRLVQANFSEPQDPTAQLLRHLDVRGPDEKDVVKLTQALKHASDERKARLADLARSTETSIAEQIAQSLSRADQDVLDLFGAVHAHSQYGSVKLVDEDVQAEIDSLEEKTQSLGDEMRRLNLENISKNIREKQRLFTRQ